MHRAARATCRRSGGRRTCAIPIRCVRRSIRASTNTGCRWPASSGSTPARAGAKARSGSATGAICIWSDIPNNRMLRWDEETGAVSVFRKPSNNGNGNTRDRQGRLVTCEHLTRRVTRTEYDGTITVICDRFEGKRLNSPNDVVVKSDGSIWFTDPRFGILGNYEGDIAEPELPMNVYRVDGKSGAVTVVADEHQCAERPRLLARREEALYRRIAQRAATHSASLTCRRRRPRSPTASCSSTPARRHAGRLRCDIDGNLWCGWGMTRGARRRARVHAARRADRPYRTAGALRQRLLRRRQAQPPVHGGGHSLYSLYVNTQGAAGG